jgi:hypothetical protein
MKHLLLTTIAAVVLVGCGRAIHDAVTEGNIESVKRHLAAGADVNAGFLFGMTPLHLAAFEGHKEIVELLIAKGADVNGKDDGGVTPLHFAALNGHKEIVNAIDNSKVFILFTSTKAFLSKNVTKELALASESDKHILPILIEDAEIPTAMKYQLAGNILHLLGLDHEKLTFYHNGIQRRLTDVHGHVIHEVLS